MATQTEEVKGNEPLAIFYDLGRIIADFRRRRNFSQKHFAEKCGITAPYLSQIEKGHKMPSYSLLAKICEELDVSQNSLFRLMFVDSFVESKDESKQEIILVLRDLLDKLLVNDSKAEDLIKKKQFCQ